MRRIFLPFAALALIALGGCSHLLPAESAAYLAKTNYVVLANAADGYLVQPRCGSPQATNGKVCSDQAVADKIAAWDNAAFAAVNTAEAAARNNPDPNSTVWQMARDAMVKFRDALKSVGITVTGFVGA